MEMKRGLLICAEKGLKTQDQFVDFYFNEKGDYFFSQYWKVIFDNETNTNIAIKSGYETAIICLTASLVAKEK